MVAPVQRILVVDDDPVSLMVISQTLQRSQSFEILEASGALEALDIIGRETLDAVLLDYTLPEMNGADVFKIARNRSSVQSTRFIFISARDDRSLRRELMALGATEVLTKPIDPASFCTRIENILK